MKLLLFDIDGTLLMTHGIGRRLLERTLHQLLSRPVTSQGVSFSGKTDLQILRELFLLNGCPDSQALRLIPEALDRYVDLFRAEITPAEVCVLPGVRTLLDRLSVDDAALVGLLTGNHRTTAYLKLGAAGLADYFPFGAFGSDHADRGRLPALAARRAAAHNGHAYAGRNIIIVGDSRHDILCGRGVGAYSVAVCTGPTARASLSKHEPDLLLDDLTDTDLFIRHAMAARE